jgi:hypothetical protein
MTISDLQLIKALLGGSIEQDSRGRLQLVYLEEGTADELSARRALARILRSDAPLDHQIRSKLAELFDPDGAWLEERKISFPFRRRGKPTDHAAAIQVFAYVNDRRKKTKKNPKATLVKAFADAALKFSISEEMAKRYWRHYSKLYGLRAGRRRESVIKSPF